MATTAFNDIMAGLEDALAYAKGDSGRGRETVVEIPVVDVRAARQRLGLTQPDFAKAFGVSVATIRNWEQRRRQPKGAARVLLTVIERNPAAIMDALRELRHTIETNGGATR
jgi:putative transcriptional regulator